MENNDTFTITKLAPLIKRKKISPVEITKFILDRIDQLQPSINAYITITAESALDQAKKAEKEIVRGRYRGALHGIPISMKDLFHIRGVRTTAGSKILKNFIAKENAVVVDRLLESGCILLGKTNMHEFAYGPTNINPHHGSVHNPWDPKRISGGSSGGSAASVVTAQAMASFGTDTGGSIRIPAAACGCVGFKPTYGRIVMQGVIPLSYSLDHAGPLSRCVKDAAFLFDAVADYNLLPTAAVIKTEVKHITIGIPRQYFFDRIQPEVRKAVLSAAEVFKELGANIHEVDLKGMDETAQLAADITGAEALAYHEEGLKRRFNDYGEDVSSRLEMSRNMSATAYIQALQKRILYRERIIETLNDVSLLLTPTLPTTAPLLDEKEVTIGRSAEDVRSMLLRLTRPGNLSGLPAISVPCGFSSKGLPIGLQLMGKPYDETELLQAAWAYESATPWHTHFPPDILLA
jgi:aspartyl-tRNA(Asn)/glutamyl-tRNA(Gln) amidotransferase subunit A